jgi:dTDP-4-dehydrorhamnose reductase
MMNQQPAPFEIWGGLEYTVNRVNDTYFDQLARSGHETRIGDLDLLAGLGIKTLRYPALWERVAPDGPESASWAWTDTRLARLKELGISPILGLVHHGSGPRHTNLLDPNFPRLLAEYAAAVAARYPWAEYFTPINEPLTTARFSGLYGYWYPHHRDGASFMRMLLTECRATAEAMTAIRQVNPSAKLVQTEDLGKTYSTPALAYQAEHENHRRWLSYDLLVGCVDERHPMWGYLRYVGIEPAELHWFLEHPCPPDILGLNYYLTSERFLDERTDLYPHEPAGSNGRHDYVDLAAVRVWADGLSGPYGLLRETWDRYHRPIAVTEIHNGGTREEQLRWFMEFWKAGERLCAEGVEFRALTSWALLGSYDWNRLLTEESGYYEPGAFDLRSPEPRPTAIAHMLTRLTGGQPFDLPPLSTPGWWRRRKRLQYTFQVLPDGALQPADALPPTTLLPPPLLITGARGTLGTAFAHACHERGLAAQFFNRSELDITDPQAVAAMIEQYRPWAVINPAGYVRVDDAEDDADACFAANTRGAVALAEVCARYGIPYITFSSDLVFDGEQDTPYVENDATNPLNVYGRSKAEAERAILDAMPSALIVRTSAFFGPWDDYNFVTVALRELRAGHAFLAADDITISPTYLPDMVHEVLDLLIDGESGIWHLANQGAVTWAEFARRAARLAGLDPERVYGCPSAELGWRARRPRYSVLGSGRGAQLPPLENALRHFIWVTGQG